LYAFPKSTFLHSPPTLHSSHLHFLELHFHSLPLSFPSSIPFPSFLSPPLSPILSVQPFPLKILCQIRRGRGCKKLTDISENLSQAPHFCPTPEISETQPALPGIPALMHLSQVCPRCVELLQMTEACTHADYVQIAESIASDNTKSDYTSVLLRPVFFGTKYRLHDFACSSQRLIKLESESETHRHSRRKAEPTYTRGMSSAQNVNNRMLGNGSHEIEQHQVILSLTASNNAPHSIKSCTQQTHHSGHRTLQFWELRSPILFPHTILVLDQS